MSALEAFILIASGVFAGIVNTLAGGGSLLIMPMLIFMGLPSAEANGTNRVAILFQAIFSSLGFRSKGIKVFPLAMYVAIPAVIGAIIGSLIAIEVKDQTFNRILAIVMLMVMGITVFKPKLQTNVEEVVTSGKIWTSVFIFFFLGIYGGFIQAGIGFLIIATLTNIYRMNMAKTNGIKVFVIFSYSIAAVLVFFFNDKILWHYGLTLAIGQSTGGWLASRWSVGKSDRLIRIILSVMVCALSIKLWFF